jgi:putative transposase
MKKSRFTDKQIAAVIQEMEAGAKMADLVRRHGVTEQTLYRWKKKYGGLQVSEVARLRALEEENRQKRLVADQALNLQVVKDLLGKSGDARALPLQRRIAVTSAVTTAELSEREACRYTGFARATQRYATRRPPHTTLRGLLRLCEDRQRQPS